jgi:hypothetical protein
VMPAGLKPANSYPPRLLSPWRSVVHSSLLFIHAATVMKK